MIKRRFGKSISVAENLPQISPDIRPTRLLNRPSNRLVASVSRRNIASVTTPKALPGQSLTPFPLLRSSTFDRFASRKQCPRQMVTIMQTEYEYDYDQTDNRFKVDRESTVDCKDETSSESSLDYINHNEDVLACRYDYIGHKEQVPPCSSRPVHNRQCTSSYPHKNLRTKNYPPSTPAVSPIGQRTSRVEISSTREESPAAILGYNIQKPFENNRFDEDSGSDDLTPTVVTCPVLTQELLASTESRGQLVKTQGRVFDWLANCETDVTSAAPLPPYLPDISGLKRFNTTVA